MRNEINRINLTTDWFHCSKYQRALSVLIVIIFLIFYVYFYFQAADSSQVLSPKSFHPHNGNNIALQEGLRIKNNISFQVNEFLSLYVGLRRFIQVE